MASEGGLGKVLASGLALHLSFSGLRREGQDLAEQRALGECWIEAHEAQQYAGSWLLWPIQFAPEAGDTLVDCCANGIVSGCEQGGPVQHDEELLEDFRLVLCWEGELVARRGMAIRLHKYSHAHTHIIDNLNLLNPRPLVRFQTSQVPNLCI